MFTQNRFEIGYISSMERILKILLFVACVIVGFMIVFANLEIDIRFLHIATYTSNNQDCYWKPITEFGYFTQAMFEQELSKDGVKAIDTIDTQKYTYAVCYGCSLDRITYRITDIVALFSNRPYYFAKAYVVKAANPNICNVYQLKKKNIDINIHTQYGNMKILF